MEPAPLALLLTLLLTTATKAQVPGYDGLIGAGPPAAAPADPVATPARTGPTQPAATVSATLPVPAAAPGRGALPQAWSRQPSPEVPPEPEAPSKPAPEPPLRRGKALRVLGALAIVAATGAGFFLGGVVGAGVLGGLVGGVAAGAVHLAEGEAGSVAGAVLGGVVGGALMGLALPAVLPLLAPALAPLGPVATAGTVILLQGLGISVGAVAGALALR